MKAWLWWTAAAGLLVAPMYGEAQAPASAWGPVFNVVDYGAKNDASAPATEAFRKAIEAAKAAGGGTVFVPAGRYVSGPIEMVSNLTLDIDTGATIEFPVAALPFVKGRYLGVEAMEPMPLVDGTDVENITITGRGTLKTADFGAWGKAYGAEPVPGKASENANGPHWDHLLKSLEAHQPVTQADYLRAAPELRPSFIGFNNAKNVLVEGVHLVGGPAFMVHLLYSENATVRNITINAYPGPHANGIVVDSSRFVRIWNDFVDTGDDGIVIKAGKDADGLRVNRPSEDVVISNCTVKHAHGAVALGSETSGNIRNLVASNITADGTENGIRIKSRRGRGGVVEDVRFDNWTMQNVGTGIEITTYYLMGGEGTTAEAPVSERTPVFRDIAISNITIAGARQVADIEGLPEMPVEGLRISNVIASAHAGLSARFTSGMELRGMVVDADQGPAFEIAASRDLELDDVKTRQPSLGLQLIRLKDCPDAVERASYTPRETKRGGNR
jgi:polygalacturonase